MSIENIFKMKRKPGIVVVGSRNFEAEEVFDEVIQNLYNFYESRQRQGTYNGPELVFVSQLFEPRKDKYYCPVYINETPNMDIEVVVDDDGNQTQKITEKGRPQRYGTIKVERIDQRAGMEFVKEWDFPHAPFLWSQQIFAVYFNLDKDQIRQSFTERDDFHQYTG